MKLGKEVVAGTLMVLVAQAALVVAKQLGWQPVAQHGWCTLAWFPWAFAAASIVLAVLMLLVGVAFEKYPLKRQTWLGRRAHESR